MLSRKAGGDRPRRTSDLPLAVQPLSQRRNPLATSFSTRVSTIRQETGATSSIHPHALETQHLIASVASHWRRGWVHDLQPTELQPEAPTAGLSEQGSYIRNTYWYEVPTVGGSGRPSPEHPCSVPQIEHDGAKTRRVTEQLRREAGSGSLLPICRFAHGRRINSSVPIHKLRVGIFSQHCIVSKPVRLVIPQLLAFQLGAASTFQVNADATRFILQPRGVACLQEG